VIVIQIIVQRAASDVAWAMNRASFTLVVLAGLGVSGCKHVTASDPTLLTANVVDPADVDAVSDFNSCSGHNFPESNSPNSAKNYFWPNSTNFSTTNVLKEFAACPGTVGQNSDDSDPNEQDRGQTFHVYCDGSTTAVRYFHLAINAGVSGHHVNAGDFLGYAVMVGTGQQPSATWQNSSNFDIAVVENGDDNTTDYFAALDGPTFAAWGTRGLTQLSQTINPGNPVCSSFISGVGSRDVLSFSPVR
jgi:hypothetical protein